MKTFLREFLNVFRIIIENAHKLSVYRHLF